MMTLALTVLTLLAAVPDNDACLVALYPATWNDRAALVEQGTTVLLNLDDCLLALAPADALPRGMPARVLERAAGNHYQYVHLRQPADLARYGRTVFATGDDYVLAVTPAAESLLEVSGLEHHRLAPIMIQRMPPMSAAPTAFAPDPLIEEMVSKVDSARYLGYVRRMQDFQTRYDFTDSCQAAAEFLYAVYDSLGLSPAYQKYRIDLPPNVIATRTGSTEPDVQVIVCGHFDSNNNYGDPRQVAPGADDNASGAIAALEIGHVLAEYNFEHTVKFIGFSGEELGLYGSIAYADSVGTANPRDSILGVIDLDMIGYMNGTHNTVTVVHNPPSTPLADSFVTATTTYVPGLTARKVIDLEPNSDHAPFWDRGYPAFCGIDINTFDPMWHHAGDTICFGSDIGGFNALGYATKIVKASLATLALYAHPIPNGPNAPTNLTATVVSQTEVRLNWQDNASDEQGYAIERQDLVQGWQVLDSVPANMTAFYDRTVYPGTPYTYRVRAFNANGFSAYSNEASVTTGAVAEQPPPVTPRLALGAPGVFRGDLVIRYALSASAPAVLRVCDVAGRTIREHRLPGATRSGTMALSGRALPAGVYFVELGQGTAQTRARVIRL